MDVFESDYGNFKLYVSDFKIGAPGYVWSEDDGWRKAKVTYVKFYNESSSEHSCCKETEDACGEFITDDFSCWVCMKEEESLLEDVDIKVIGYC